MFLGKWLFIKAASEHGITQSHNHRITQSQNHRITDRVGDSNNNTDVILLTNLLNLSYDKIK